MNKIQYKLENYIYKKYHQEKEIPKDFIYDQSQKWNELFIQITRASHLVTKEQIQTIMEE